VRSDAARAGRSERPARARAVAEEALLAEARTRARDLLARNLTRHGIRASAPTPQAAARAYTAVFARDAAICALGMAVSGDAALERRAHVGLATLGSHQARNGQVPKFVDPARREADFWYLGCIDATLWWLLWIAFVDARRGERRLRERYAARIARAIAWLEAQEHQRFRLLQQNEASDWADIMPRSGFVLYTNALWCAVKRAFGLAQRHATLEHFHGLFHPFSAGIAEYRRARLLAEYGQRQSADRDLYLSFVNFTFVGDEGDVLGNALAVALGIMDGERADAVLDALDRARVAHPHPSRATCRPVRRRSLLWRPYMARHEQNYAWQYHNGGSWPMVGAFHVLALVERERHAQAREQLLGLAHACRLRRWSFPEWLHGRTGTPRGMPGQSWSAAGFLLAEHAVRTGANPLARTFG
jgi:glycogen debranching enzyme